MVQGQNVLGNKLHGTSPSVLNSWSTKAAGFLLLTGYWGSDIQWLKMPGNIVSLLLFPQWRTSREQQMKFPFFDEAYISDLDLHVVSCGGGVPGDCISSKIQTQSVTINKAMATIGHHRSYGSPCACKRNPSIRRWV